MSSFSWHRINARGSDDTLKIEYYNSLIGKGCIACDATVSPVIDSVNIQQVAKEDNG
jgi:hypothetical protein